MGVCGGAKCLPVPYYSHHGLFASKGGCEQGKIFGSALLLQARSVCVSLSAFIFIDFLGGSAE